MPVFFSGWTLEIDCFVLPAVYRYNFNAADQIRLKLEHTISFSFYIGDTEVIKEV